jgi:hypothetical protein
MRHTEHRDPEYPLPDCVGSGCAMYDMPNDEDEVRLTAVSRRADGGYYGENGKWDFAADDAEAMRAKLRKWGCTYVGWEN